MFDFRIVVSNGGVITAQNVVLADTLPTQGSFVSSNPSGSPSGGTLTLSLGNISPGESVIVTVRWRAPDTDATLTNSATASADNAAPSSDSVTVSARADQESVSLGTADSFAVLAGSTITNSGPTTINGDVGLHPGGSVTGFGSVTLNGELHVADAVADQAKQDLVAAYNAAAGRAATTVSTELAGQVLPAGVYDSESGTFELTGTVTLDAQGNPDAVFIFQMATTLVIAPASVVNLIGGAKACNVFWQVGSSATLGTNSAFAGTILALASITVNAGATVDGRTLARDGAVTLDTNVITASMCTRGTC